MTSEATAVDGERTLVINQNYEEVAVYVKNENHSLVLEKTPFHIILGHELIHILRSINGERKNNHLYGRRYSLICPEIFMQEEFETVGLSYTKMYSGQPAFNELWSPSQGQITENVLRAEHNVNNPNNTIHMREAYTTSSIYLKSLLDRIDQIKGR